ncbi:MAG: hypothetical protein OXG35_09860 [Acidobacteria bacterium]|nr:hypothetical protein [Acidobacteriota bacterium]
MEILVNDRSLHEQFHDVGSFRDALARLMAMRSAARRFGRDVHCHRALLTASPIPGVVMQQAIGRLAVDKQRAAMVWLTRSGPFWDDLRRHGPGDRLECGGRIVTNSAVGEAAFRALHGADCGLISFTPSDWDYSPVDVTWRREDQGADNRSTALRNWRSAPALEAGLRDTAPPLRSWDDLRQAAAIRFESLTCTEDCFEPLSGVPFAKGAGDRFLVLLDILDRFARSFDRSGPRTAEGQRIYQDYFTGDNAPFSDSSDDEKRNFREALTFRHPNEPGGSLFCPWHGKVRHMTLRLHFSWPVRAGRPVYVVYAGPKLTKR